MMAPEIVLRIGGGVRAARRRSLAKLLSDAAKEKIPNLSLCRASLDGTCVTGGGRTKLPYRPKFEAPFFFALFHAALVFAADDFTVLNIGASFLGKVVPTLA